jgi:uncharacterized protein YegL
MAGKEFDPFDLDSFDFGDFDSLDTGVDVQTQPVATPDVSNIVTTLRKRAMVVFFVVDISGSMRGARIGAVNDAIRNVLPELKKRERGNTAAEIRIAVLEFSTRANWRTLSPQPVSTYQYQDIENVGGGTNYGTAFAALNEKLSRKQFLNATAGAYTPLIIFMTDGKPSDMGLYKEELERLKQNKWFQYSTRAGIAIEEGALSPECKRVLMEFTENDKNVYEAKNTVILAKQIELVTLTGVDFVTQQGSIQNTNTNVAQRSPSFHSTSTPQQTTPPRTTTRNTASANTTSTARESQPVSPPPAAESASPTLPIGEIDWEHDFDF